LMKSASARHGRSGDPAIADAVLAATAAGRAISDASGSATASRAVQSLSLCCETLVNSMWPEMAWRFSGLTSDGSPLEFTFSSADNLLRYTVDAAPAETENHQRIAAACDQAVRLGHQRPDDKCISQWTLMQRDHNLNWGARLGIRESGVQEKVKFYLEVPFDAQAAVRSFINLPLRDSTAVMIGYEPQSGRTEYYFRQQQFSEPQLDWMLGMVDDEHTRVTLLAGIEYVCGMPLASALRWTCFGYSLAVRPHSRTPELTFFARCRAIGGAAQARQRMLQRMPSSVKERSLYYQLLADLPTRDVPDHGVVSLSCAKSSMCEIRVGLSNTALLQLLQRSSMTA
jgi:hypothetical protein